MCGEFRQVYDKVRSCQALSASVRLAKTFFWGGGGGGGLSRIVTGEKALLYSHEQVSFSTRWIVCGELMA